MRLSFLQLLFIILLPILIFISIRAIPTAIEGYILSSSEKILNNNLPYRDFHFSYTPGSLFLTSLFFEIFKPSILSSRILMSVISIISIILIFKCVVISTKNRMYAALSGALFICALIPPFYYNPPIFLSLSSALAVIYLLLKYQNEGRGLHLFLAGLFSFVTFILWQNFGIMLFIPAIIFFILSKRIKINQILLFIYGYVWSFIAFAIYLLLTGSFSPFFYEIAANNFQKIIFITIPSNTLFLLLPIILYSITIFLLFIRERNNLFFLVAFVVSFYLMSLGQTPDTIFFITIATLGIPISIYLRFNLNSSIRFIIFGSIFIFIFMSSMKLATQTSFEFFANPKINIYVTHKTKVEWEKIIEIVHKNLINDAYMYADTPFQPLLSFILNRRETVDTNLINGTSLPNDYQDLRGNLIAKNTEIILLKKGTNPPTLLTEYIYDNYKYISSTNSLLIFKRNP